MALPMVTRNGHHRLIEILAGPVPVSATDLQRWTGERMHPQKSHRSHRPIVRRPER